jgi:plastocyanin
MKDRTVKANLALTCIVIANLVLAAIPSSADTVNQIAIKDFMFSPMTLSVSAGTSVTWRNLDGEPHLVVSLDGAFRSQALDQGDSFSFKFDKPGIYKYICTIHPQMKGTITVK